MADIPLLRKRKIRCCRGAGKPAVLAECSRDQRSNPHCAGQTGFVQAQPLQTQHSLAVAARSLPRCHVAADVAAADSANWH